MISGQQALGTIDQTLQQARQQIEEVEQRMNAVTSKLLELDTATGNDYRALAKVRIDHLASTNLDRHLDDAQQQVIAVLQRRDLAMADLNRNIQAKAHHRDQLEAQRSTQAMRVNQAVDAVDDAEASTQSRLDADATYQTQRQRAEEAQRHASHADEKATNSEQELTDKGKSYRDDPMFSYLWQRNYGLPSYRASGLIRWLDAKVARLIGFADARANYARLNEIPKRLRAHADRLKAHAETEFQALKTLDEAARSKDGIPQLVTTLNEAQRTLDAIDRELEVNTEQNEQLLSEKSAYATGDDEHTRKAIDYLASEFEREDVMRLRHDALTTPFPDDDLIIARLLDRDTQRHELEQTLAGFRDALQRQRSRLAELETIRVEFKRHRFDRAGSIFEDNSLIVMMLGQFLQGMLDRRMLWRILQEQQRYRPRRSNPTFGSGGFGRGTVWNGGIGDVLNDLGRSRSGPRMPLPRRGGGGFRTGGGF